MADFFAMGGYAAYVWPAYGIFFGVLAWDWLAPTLKRRRLLTALRGRLVRERGRHAAVAKKAEAST